MTTIFLQFIQVVTPGQHGEYSRDAVKAYLTDKLENTLAADGLVEQFDHRGFATENQTQTEKPTDFDPAKDTLVYTLSARADTT